MKNSGLKKMAFILMVLTTAATLFLSQKANAQATLVTVKSTKGFDETVAQAGLIISGTARLLE
ncbi:MAG TPA: hypothetical protein VIM16_24210 [Mucilaginibacter sp.]|jgi:hypothetical protein